MWQELQTVKADQVVRLRNDIASPADYLSILGLTGLTAYFALQEIGKPKEGETVVVSGAAGAVGSSAGQIALIKGCFVVGIAGSDDKVSFLKDELQFNEAVNYHQQEWEKALASACPKGVDVYFDNVGGEI